MASFNFDPKTGKARVFFRYGGRQFNKTIKIGTARAAEGMRATIEETITDLQRGRLTLPPEADVTAFLLSGGKLTESPAARAIKKSLSLADLFDEYRADPPPHLEASTRKIQEIHFRRLLEVFPNREMATFDKSAAQGYVAARSKQSYRKKPIQRQTIEKELQTLRQAWVWVSTRLPEVAAPSFALKDLSFPKAKEKLPFMTWEEIEQEIARGGLSDDKAKELWDCLWLDKIQVREFLDHVRQAAAPRFLYPMVCLAAFTGARRSELCRSRIADFQFERGIVRLRQKKRDKDKEFTFRDVRLNAYLAGDMKSWLAGHPGGQHAFCHVDRQELTWNAAAHHFKAALKGSKWKVLRGWHVLRHSFASNLAAAGIDQRMIDRWMGHSTDVKWRYQHLRPRDQQDAIDML